jgi:hypothetical protein
MNAQTKIEAPETRFMDAYNALSDREALRLLKQMAERFSGCGYSYDKLEAGIEQCAVCCAEDEGWRGDDLAYRYLESQTRFGPSYTAHVMVSTEPMPALSKAWREM